MVAALRASNVNEGNLNYSILEGGLPAKQERSNSGSSKGLVQDAIRLKSPLKFHGKPFPYSFSWVNCIIAFAVPQLWRSRLATVSSFDFVGHHKSSSTYFNNIYVEVHDACATLVIRL